MIEHLHPHLCRDLILPGGLMFDGELVSGDDERGRGASVSHYMKECPEKLVYCAFDLIFDAGAVDLRGKPFEYRRERMLRAVKALGSPFVKASEALPPTMAEIEKLWATGWEGGILKDLDVMYRGKRAMKKTLLPKDACSRLHGVASALGLGHQGASVSHYIAHSPEKLKLVAFDLIYDVGAVDIRQKPLHFRQGRLLDLVRKLDSPRVQCVGNLPPTMEEIKKLWDAGWEGGILKDLDSVYKGSCSWEKRSSVSNPEQGCLSET